MGRPCIYEKRMTNKEYSKRYRDKDEKRELKKIYLKKYYQKNKEKLKQLAIDRYNKLKELNELNELKNIYKII